MHADPLHSMIPLERYRELVGALPRAGDAWDDAFWLRFAAQVAVLCPDPIPLLAQRIREVAAALSGRSAWYRTLASPARFVIAAMLIQHHLPVAYVLAEHGRTAALMSEVGLRHGGLAEVIAVLILLMSPGHEPASMLEIERLKAIYDQMKRLHWWLTGPEDLPACAALAQCPGPAEVVVARVEEAYQQLREAGVPAGEHLQTAAALLSLTGLGSDQTVARYRGLAIDLAARSGPISGAAHTPLALLTLLDHEPALVIGRWLAVTRELDLLQPAEQGQANLLIASDLTILDLMRSDRALRPFTQPHAIRGMLRTLHAYHLGSTVLLAQVEPDLLQLVGESRTPTWPYP